MQHRISAGVLVGVGDRVLLVRCVKRGAYDFWVAPGGGVEGPEDLRAAVRREAREECGLEIEPLEIAYVEDLYTAEQRICKVWFAGRLVGGELSSRAAGAAAEHIVDAQFLSRAELDGKTVFPQVLLDRYWTDKVHGFGGAKYLGMRRMETG